MQIYIQEELDDALGVEALRTRSSKAAIIRELVAERLGSQKRERDPVDDLIGSIDAEPGDVDDVVYGR